MAQEDDRGDDQPTDVPSPTGGDHRPEDDEPIFEGIDDDTDAIIIAPARKPTPASGGLESPVPPVEWVTDIGGIIITGAPGPGPAKKPGPRSPKASPMGDANSPKGRVIALWEAARNARG
jgi:hypothetical protein